jgi:cullin-4
MGVSLFRRIIFEDSQLQVKILDGMCDIVTSDRAGQAEGETLCRNAISMFHELSVYTHVIEPRLLHLAQTYVMEWADNAVKSMTLAEYVNGSVTLMDSELKRCETVGLDLSTRRELLTLLEHQLIQRRQEKLRTLIYYSRVRFLQLTSCSERRRSP